MEMLKGLYNKLPKPLKVVVLVCAIVVSFVAMNKDKIAPYLPNIPFITPLISVSFTDADVQSIAKWVNDEMVKEFGYSKQADASALSGSFVSIAGQIKSGVISEKESIILTTRLNNTKVVSDSEVFVPFFEELKVKLSGFESDKKLDSKDNIIKCWAGIASGFKYYAETQANQQVQVKARQ